MPSEKPTARWLAGDSGLYAVLKRGLDIAGSAMGLALSAPVMAATAAAVGLTMGRPVLFRQPRPGLHGRPFDLIKVRTMRPPDPNDTSPRDAERLTPTGALLRRLSLDELPTLWNVLRGDMSLVGPRPLLMRYLPRYTPEQARRHEVKPGVTGWAQIHGRNALSWEDKFRLDVWYVDHRSFALDLQILASTVWKVVRREGIGHGLEATMPEFMGTPESKAS